VRDATRLARYGGLKELRGPSPHAIKQLFFYAVTPEAEPTNITPILIDISAPEFVMAWTAAMEAHATQAGAATTSGCNSFVPGCSARAPELVMPSLYFQTNHSCLDHLRRRASEEREGFDVDSESPLKIGITCYPSIGGSGILASSLGEELARRGHEVHFISYERPFRMPVNTPRLFFHPVVINDYRLFKYPDYTLPLSVKMAEVSRDHQLDILHVHYAVPHATAAILARSMLPPEQQPRVVTTLHGTDTTLLGYDPGYGPAIHHALTCSDAVTTVSEFLKQETQRVLGFDGPMEDIHNFFEPRAPQRSRKEMRHELGLRDEAVVLHSSNLHPSSASICCSKGRAHPSA
jgi:Glycosyltransferase Family 4